MNHDIFDALKTCGAVFLMAIGVMYLGVFAYVQYAHEMDWSHQSIGIGVTAIVSGVLALAIVAMHLVED